MTEEEIAGAAALAKSRRRRAGSSIAMMGAGFYSTVSLGPKAVIDNSTPLVLEALSKLDLEEGRTKPLNFADYGAADGGTSLDLVGAAIDWVRARYPRLPVGLYYTDLPSADFETLFRIMGDEIESKPSPFGNDPNTHVFSTGMSFYRQLLPKATLDIGFSASAMHYLSTMPGVIREHVHAVGASEAEKALYRAVALKDWETILLKRSLELAPGGQVVLVNFCIDEMGRYLGNTGGESLFDTYNELWQGMRDDRIITADEYTNTAFQQYYKSIDESLAPLLQEANPVYQSGLTLEHYKVEHVECPFRRAYDNGLRAGEFALQFVNTHRSWTETTFRSAIDAKRSADEIEVILDELYYRYEQRVLAAPQNFRKDFIHLYLVARKRAPMAASPSDQYSREFI